MNDLETASTDELIDELKRRYPTLVVTGMRESLDDPQADERILIHNGNLLMAIGLLGVAERALYRKVREVERDAE